MPFIKHDRIQFCYELTGVGPVVVFCHGLTGDLEQSKQLVGSLDGFRLLVWDARGHGRTQPVGPAEGFKFPVFAEDLAALLDHLKVKRAVIGGISMGAAVATCFAAHYPDRVRGLVLVRPAWLERPLPQGLRLFPEVANYLRLFGAENGCQAFENSADYRDICDRLPESAQTLRDQFFKEQAVERSARLTEIPNDAPIKHWEEIQSMQMPALVFGNEPDWVHPLAYAVIWAERLPQGHFIQVAAKSVNFELHARAVRTHLAAFLKTLPL